MGKPDSYSRHATVEKGRIAVLTMGVKIGDETRGYTRFRKLAEMLVAAGFEVDLITSSFQHWEKKQRDKDSEAYRNLPYDVVFIDEPGYSRNLDLVRINSHRIAAKNTTEYFRSCPGRYCLIYAEIPPNDVALSCALAAEEQGIPFIADINDLWPEAMRMVVDIPVVSDVMFYPFARDAKRVYRALTAAVGTSDEYADRPAADRTEPYPHITVYVGNDLSRFDQGVAQYAGAIDKPDGEVWVVYAGTLGASYDIRTLIKASVDAARRVDGLRVKILGDGPDREALQQLADKIQAPVDFLGYQDYPHMAAYLSVCDITVNSLVKDSAQSIVTKIGDYLASDSALINTGNSLEFKHKVEEDGFGVNVNAENVEELTDAIVLLARNSSMRKIMASKGRAIAEKQFDQQSAYKEIVHLIQTLV